MWRTARGIRSLGSFHGNRLISAFGASIALSSATAYGWAGESSGRTRIGVWQPRTKSRFTVKTKSGSVSNIFVTNASTVGIVISGRLAVSAGPHVFLNTPGYFGSRASGPPPTPGARDPRTTHAGGRVRVARPAG